ncbi:hypothetical protein M1293_03385 [Candidatus Parvarchaeota archaeon]|nr:hypothetical protein [Candidatus Parvarchaeota archaeon]
MINAEYVLFAGVLGVILLDLLRIGLKRQTNNIIHYVTFGILILSFITELVFGNMNVEFFSSVQYSYFVNGFVLFISVAVYAYLLIDTPEHSTYIDVLYLFAVLGATLVIISSNFISLLIAIEMISIASYSLVFFQKTLGRMEATMKYVAISFISVIILIFGISLIYAGAGTLSFGKVSNVDYLPFILGVGIVIAGLAFKATIVPFHMWAPDVYESSNSAVTAFLVSVSKTAGLLALIRVFFFGFQVSSSFVSIVFFGLAIATIFFATFLASVQDRIKRLLAYSSIAQAGFAFIGLALLNRNGVSASIFYIFSFAVADALVFLAYKIFEDKKIIYLKDANRMPRISKIATAAMFIGVLSLFGLPPTIGFFGKLLIFSALLAHGYVSLVIALFAILLFSTFYYANILMKMDLSDIHSSQNEGQNIRIRMKEVILVLLMIAIFAGVMFAGI